MPLCAVVAYVGKYLVPHTSHLSRALSLCHMADPTSRLWLARIAVFSGEGKGTYFPSWAGSRPHLGSQGGLNVVYNW